jgi:hypothetical protein
LAVAKQQGLDEAMADKVDHYWASDLPAHQKAALRLADALMTQPGAIDADLCADLRRHFTEQQILEITVDVMKWNYQKVSVALGVDFEVKPGALADLIFDDNGHWVRP